MEFCYTCLLRSGRFHTAYLERNVWPPSGIKLWTTCCTVGASPSSPWVGTFPSSLWAGASLSSHGWEAPPRPVGGHLPLVPVDGGLPLTPWTLCRREQGGVSRGMLLLTWSMSWTHLDPLVKSSPERDRAQLHIHVHPRIREAQALA